MTLQDLSQYGFDVDMALELCIGDEDILKEVLEVFLEEGREKLPLFEELIGKNDMDRYIIEAHGLKNAAKQVGAMTLSEMAKSSELTGKAGDLQTVKDMHPALLAEYKKAVDALAEYIEG